MKLWLTVTCILGCLGGGFTLYSAISVGSSGLATMSTALQQISPALTAYSTALNTARTSVYVILNDLMGYMNITYTAINKTWAVNQTEYLQNVLQQIGYFNQSIGYGDQSVSSQVIQNLYSMNYGLQSNIDNMMSYYNSLVSQMYSTTAENCTLRNATQMANVPVSLAKYATCLQLDTAAVTQYLPSVLNMFAYSKTELISQIAQLKNCSSYSATCQNAYFQQIYSEVSNTLSSLSSAHAFLSGAFYEAGQRDQFCGQLIEADIQDSIQNLTNAFSLCSWPPSN
ncbi:uncharacterized protein LOC129724142 [Wyeomyia smithii]|uniref:uncharacterized protein LOC129724142 n=1 Tax=Wyeomyia smithii TaxID=174621 RepID=UPI0024682129|nr:uncharacterized protein LOC129724142 [Wyeomyia smithii]